MKTYEVDTGIVEDRIIHSRRQGKIQMTKSREMTARTITIKDDFDLGKIISCGQCFRAREMDDGSYRFVTGNHVLYLKPIEKSYDESTELKKGIITPKPEDNDPEPENNASEPEDNDSEPENNASEPESEFEISCSEEEWNQIWHPYFDLDRDYSSVRRAALSGETSLIRNAAVSGRGIRVLRQDPWEMLITFIISQRKSIPAIAGSVEALCRTFGAKIRNEDIYAFPTPEALVKASDEELKSCALGYRLGYVKDAARKVAQGELDLEALDQLDDERLKNELMSVRGVGIKVANCVSLFGYGRCGCVPVDVWISRAIQQCEENDPFAAFGENGGIVQQYVFYHMKHEKG